MLSSVSFGVVLSRNFGECLMLLDLLVGLREEGSVTVGKLRYVESVYLQLKSEPGKVWGPTAEPPLPGPHHPGAYYRVLSYVTPGTICWV